MGGSYETQLRLAKLLDGSLKHKCEVLYNGMKFRTVKSDYQGEEIPTM